MIYVRVAKKPQASPKSELGCLCHGNLRVPMSSSQGNEALLGDY